MKKIRKAVIPVAGYGTRFLPATKAMPKEMLTIVDKPVIQYVVEEAIEAGIEEIIFITSSNKRALEDHFDSNFELEERLRRSGKEKELKQIIEISNLARFVYIRQKVQRGSADAILTAKSLVGDEPFLVLLGDEFVSSTPGRAKQLIDIYHKSDSPVITVMESQSEADTFKYGFISAREENGMLRVLDVVEKPGPEKVPSKYAVIGGYIFEPEVFKIFEELPQDTNGETSFADGLLQFCQSRPVHAHLMRDFQYYDAGSKSGFLKANVDFGLTHPDTKEELRDYLRKLQLD